MKVSKDWFDKHVIISMPDSMKDKEDQVKEKILAGLEGDADDVHCVQDD